MTQKADHQIIGQSSTEKVKVVLLGEGCTIKNFTFCDRNPKLLCFFSIMLLKCHDFGRNSWKL